MTEGVSMGNMNSVNSKLLLGISFLVCLLNSGGVYAKKRQRATVDKTLAIIYHGQGSTVILQSDLRPDLSDQVPSLRDGILKELILIDGAKYKITVTEAEVDRHLARIQESLKKSREDLVEFFKERGYTFDEAKKELEKSLLIETTIGERVRSKAIVSESEIKRYYEEYQTVEYVIKQTFRPFGLGSKAITRAKIDQEIESGEIVKGIEWSEPIVLKEADIAQEKAYIKELKNGAVTKIAESDEGISLLQVVSKGKVPYEDVKRQITMELGSKKQKQALDDYYGSLLKNARVRYFNKEHKIS